MSRGQKRKPGRRHRFSSRQHQLTERTRRPDTVIAPRRRPEDEPGPKTEREACNCGLAQVGYVASWAIAHVDACPAAALFRGREGYL